MRIIVLGIILTIVGAVGWATSVIFAVLSGGQFKWAANFFGIMMLICLPSALLIRLVQYLKKKK